MIRARLDRMDTDTGGFMKWTLRALRHAALLCTLLLLPAAGFAGFFISNGQLVDNNGTPFIMRGVNYPYTWFQSRNTQQDLAAIAATGANTVRVVLSTGGQWARVNGAQVSQLIQWCKDLRMIAVLEVHDSTGWNESGGAVPISNATAYWTSSDIRAAINGQENFVIINIANEPFGNTTTANYVADTSTAIRALRTAGLAHTLMIDGATWGQDWQGTMRDNAMTLWNADSLHNLVFSVHMYEVYQSLSPIQAYMQAFQALNLPLVVGEFGPVNNGQFVDSESVIAQAAQRRLGYLGWSWSGNGGGGTGLDMTNSFDPASLTTWGNRIINGTNGIRASSVPATVFGPAGSSLTVAPTSLSFTSGAASVTVSVTANVSWSVTDNQSWLSVSPASGANNGNFTVSATANTGAAARSGTVTATAGGITRTIAVSQAAASTGNTLTLSASSWSAASTAASTTVNVTSNVSWTVSDDQAWLSASTTAGSGNGNFMLSATANSGTTARTGTVTVAGGGLTRTITVTQAAQSGSVTASGVVTSSSGWFSEEQVRVNNTASITALSVTITVQRTAGVNASGQYNTVGGQVAQSSSCGSTACTYLYTLSSGQTLAPGTGRTFAAQMSGNGTVHPTAGDTFIVTGTAGGASFSVQGSF
jgi:mannan endo-1,4-beta-mannosidase